MPTITKDLLEGLKQTSDIGEFLDRHQEEFITETPVGFLNDRISEKGLTVAEVARASGIGEYVYKVFNGERKPSRDVLLAITLGMGLSLEETQLLLRISKFAILDSRDRRDSILIYAALNRMSVFAADELLAQNQLLTLR